VQWNGSSRTTTFVSATQLTATIPAVDIASPTSAVRGGQGRSFAHLGKKSPLHFDGSGDGRGRAKPLREVEAEPIEEGSLGRVRAHDAAQAELAPILGGQHDVGALNAL
jgi:hypothetical protein